MKIIVTSESQIKIKTVKEIFGTDHQVTGTKSNSGIPEQPYGAGETIKGAKNRITSAKIPPDTDLIISIENGIVLFGLDFIDIAVIVGYNPLTKKYTPVTSVGIPVDSDLANEAIFDKAQKITVGELMSKKYGCDAKDPHNHITGVTRKKILKDALQLLRNILKV